MRNFVLLKKLVLLISMVLFLTTSCENEPLDPSLLEINDPYFEVKVDGELVSAKDLQFVVDLSGQVSFKAQNINTNENFTFKLPSFEKDRFDWSRPQTDFNNFQLSYKETLLAIPYQGMPQDRGNFASFPMYEDLSEFIIDQIDTEKKTVSGSFKFNGVRFKENTTDEIEIKKFTDGLFRNVKYVDQRDLGSDDDNDDDNQGIEQTFFAKIDGQSFSPTVISTIDSMGRISITALNQTENKTIGVNFPNSILVGTYQLSAFGDYKALYNANTTQTTTTDFLFQPSSGTLEILSFDHTNNVIKGKFSFEGSPQTGSANAVSITEGTFTVQF